MTMPEQKPGRSEQEVCTPPELLESVQERLGYIGFDLAATSDNSVVADRYYGPGSTFGQDALAETCSWITGGTKILWLNPPFANIAPWARKCVQQSSLDARIALLAPAAVGSNWFNLWVRPFAYVLELTPRVTFVGHKTAYPKDLILAVYGPERFIGREPWHWRRPKAPANDNAVDPRQLALPTVVMGAA